MPWLVFAYSLPSKPTSSLRVTIWRRLRRLGAVAPAGGVYVLPPHEGCREGFQWLAQEIRQANGEALIMRVEHFEGLTDHQVITAFQTARSEEYTELEQDALALEQQLATATSDERVQLQETLDKLRRRHAEIARIDYFANPDGMRVAARLTHIARTLTAEQTAPVDIAPALRDDYVTVRWVTRPRPHVDRLASAWLIRRFINPDATIRYATQPEPDEVAFDMPEAQFGHQGNLCTFETMLRAFNLTDPALQTLAEIVHEIDLRDGRYHHAAIDGIDAVLQGWLLEDIPDAEREQRGIALFEGLYLALTARAAEHSVAAQGGQP